MKQFFTAILAISTAAIFLPGVVLGAAFPEDYSIHVDQTRKEVSLVSSSASTTISLPSKAKYIQATSIQKGGVDYATVLYHKGRKVVLRVYHPDGTKLVSKKIFQRKRGQIYPSTRLDIITKQGKRVARVRMVRTNKQKVSTRTLTKTYFVRPNKNKAKNRLKRQSKKSDRITKPALTGNDEADSLALINYYRAIAGQLPVKENSEYSQGCENHVSYMHQNQTITHFESPSNPGYTELGAQTGPSANVGGGTDSLYENIERWMASVYHRFPILEPYVTEVGFHYFNHVSCLYFDTDLDLYFMDHAPIPFPAPDQTEAPNDFIGLEDPDPLSGHVSNPDAEYPVGTVVSLQFSSYQEVESMTVTLRDSNGNAVYGYTRLPDDSNDPNRLSQRNAVTYIAADPLASNHTYSVTFSGVVDGSSYSKSWSFTTD